jgi:hypothetical protein
MTTTATSYDSRTLAPERPLVQRALAATVRFLQALREGCREAEAMRRQAERTYPYLRFDS